MVNPGSFQGTRRAFIHSQKGYYEEAVQGGYAKDAVAIIQRRYFKRYPIDLPHDEEPSEEHLAAVDDDAPEPDAVEPDPDNMTEAEYNAAKEAHSARARLIVFRKGQIKRRLAYQYLKDHDLDPKESGLQNPYSKLLCRLTGTQVQRPRAQSPMNLYRKAERENIEKEALARATSSNTSKSRGLLGLRAKITKEWYDQLSNEEQEDWKKLAKEEHDLDVAKWEAEFNRGTSTCPKDRQRCIETLARFVQPILDGICDATGWKATLMAGGPEPAQDGILNMISVHSGTISGDVKMNFGRSEHARYTKFITPIFGEFLKKCYSIEECKSRALTGEDATGGLSTLEDEISEGVIHQLGFPHATPTPPPPLLDTTQSGISGGNQAGPSQAATINGNNRPSATTSQSNNTGSRASSNSPNVTSTRSASPQLQTSTNANTASTPSTTQGISSGLPEQTSPRQPLSTQPSHPSPTAHNNGVVPHSVRRSGSPSRLSPCLSPPPSPGLSPPASPSVSAPKESDQPPPSTFMAPNIASGGAASLPPTHPPSNTLLPRATGVSELIHLGTCDMNSGQAQQVPDGIANASPPQSKRPRDSDDSQHNDGASAMGGSGPTAAKKRRVGRGKENTGVGHGVKGKRGTGSKGRGVGKMATAVPTVDAVGTAANNSAIQPAWFSTWSTAFVARSKDIGKGNKLWLGLEWLKLVEEWVAFEQESGFKQSPRLPSTNRPEMVHLWIKNARSVEFNPKIVDVKSVQTQFDCWWDGLQPSWRKGSDGKVVRRRVDGDWSALRYPGLNGLISVVASLFYIGLAAHEVGRTRIPWVYAVEDVTLAIQHLRSSTSSSA